MMSTQHPASQFSEYFIHCSGRSSSGRSGIFSCIFIIGRTRSAGGNGCLIGGSAPALEATDWRRESSLEACAAPPTRSGLVNKWDLWQIQRENVAGGKVVGIAI